MTRYLAVVSAFIMAMFVAVPAYADDCNTMVVDETGRLGTTGTATVTEAGNRLVNAGADVRVRVIPSAAAYGNLDQYMARMQSQCASWRAADGGRKNNLLVVLVSMDRQSGVFFGEQYRSALDGRTAGIRTNSMNPRFRDADFGGGIAAGLDASGRLIAAAAAPPVNTAPGPAQPPVVVHEQPTDLSGLWTVMGWGLGLVALGLLIFLIARMMGSRAKRRAAQQTAQAKRSSCANRIVELDQPIILLGARITKAAQAVSEEDIKPYRDELAAIKALADTASGQYNDLQMSQNNPDRNGLSEEEYAAMTGEFQQVLTGFDQVKTRREALETKLGEIQKQIDSARPAISALDDEIKVTASAIAGIEDLGYKTGDAEATLTEAMTALEAAETAFAAKRFGAVKASCATGSKKCKDASAQAAALPKRKEALDAAVLALKGRLPTVQTAIQEGRSAYEEISSQYAEGCWSSIKGNGTEAVKRLQAATKSSVEATVASAMDRQEWQKGEDTVTQANAWLDEAESFMRSLTSLKATLEAAKRDAQPEIDAAQADVTAARRYEQQFDEDISDSYKKEIADAQTLLDSAKEEFAKDKPDYILVVKNAKKANSAADKILSECQGEHEGEERKRRLAVSEQRDAEAAISRAQEYIDDHKSDVESGAKEKLKAAKATLQKARDTAARTSPDEDVRRRTLASRVTLLQQAHKEADEAYKKAKKNVSDAEDERESARQAAAAAARSRASSSSSGSDAFTGGLIGGIIGSSIGGGGSSSSSSDSGGFGGWGSGGGGGGGDSGGWGSSGGGGDSGSFGSSGGGGGDSGSW
ncbi:MAG TPA: TPM domain-containing protein [Candidatus Eisenbacteria bacterium]|nr:TPM domain-containing protein [Candidatus Eisenbacteria bacterium]